MAKKKPSPKSKKSSSQKKSNSGIIAVASAVVLGAFVIGYALSSSNSGAPAPENSMQAVQTSATSGDYQDVSAEEAKKLIDAGDIQVVDVRTEWEYKQGYIKGAVLIPDTEIADRLAELKEDKPVLVYCATGARSAQAASVLAGQGFKKVYNMAGGIVRWPYGTVK